MSSKNLVFVKPIVKQKWHGLDAVGRSKFKDTQDTLQVLYDPKLGKNATGLTEEDVTRLSTAIGSELNPSSEFWNTFRIKLKDETMIFDPRIPLQELQVKVLKASKFVANSEKELDEGKWPRAKYVIYDEAIELEKQANEVHEYAKAVDTFNGLSEEKKLDMLKLYGKNTENASRDFVYTRLFELVEEGPKEFLRLSSLKTEEIKVRALIFDLERMGIFRRKSTAYLYNDQQVGFDYDDTVANLLDPSKQELLVKLKTDVETRKA